MNISITCLYIFLICLYNWIIGKSDFGYSHRSLVPKIRLFLFDSHPRTILKPIIQYRFEMVVIPMEAKGHKQSIVSQYQYQAMLNSLFQYLPIYLFYMELTFTNSCICPFYSISQPNNKFEILMNSSLIKLLS